MKRRAQGGYRWFDHLVAMTENEMHTLTWKDNEETLEQLKEPPPFVVAKDVQELKKTREERICLKAAFKAVNQMLKRYGQPVMKFRQKDIHILPDVPEVNDALGYVAIAELGQVCMIRQPNPELTLFVMVHELVHLAAINTMVVNIPSEEEKRQGKQTKFMIQRSGFSFVDKNRILFGGLNEAITEMLAQEVRRKIPNDGEVAEVVDLKKMITHYDAEMESRALIQGICSRLVSDHGTEKEFIRQSLVIDYFTGSHYFLQTLHKHWPEAAFELSHLTRNPMDIADIAEQLGLENLARTIRFIYQDD